jgi:phosphatidylserine/phosphatidylglycerophosphate/cardiolipin synthase-like enzyme
LVGLIFLLGLACTSPLLPVIVGSPETPTIGVFFSPEGGATEVIVSEMSNAKQEILVQAYSFTSAPIAKALLAAYERDVKVIVVLDRSSVLRGIRQPPSRVMPVSPPTLTKSTPSRTTKSSSSTRRLSLPDRSTSAEEKNAENLLVIRGDDALVKKYLANFKEHLGNSDSN